MQGDARPVLAAGQHRRTGPTGQQARRTTDVVAVVVGMQDRHQLQPLPLQRRDHRLGKGRIHHRRQTLAVQHKDVVIPQERNQFNAELLHR